MERLSIKNLVKEIIAHNPLQKKFLENSINKLDDDHINGLEEYIVFCEGQGISIEFLAQSYNFIVRETMREQMFFQKNKRYRYSTYKEVAQSVYLNDDYMAKYMYGLAVTSFLWKQHQQMHTFFEQVLPHDKKGSFLEIGSGHGYYFMKALRSTAFDNFTAIDISPTSVEMTKSIVKANVDDNLFSKTNIYECDFLNLEITQTFEGLVMGEVLEHVESPMTFLEKIHTLVNPDSFVYITTCANAPEIDHLFLFKNDAEIIDLVKRAGFQVENQLVVPYNDYSVEETIAKELPLNVALSLKKQ